MLDEAIEYLKSLQLQVQVQKTHYTLAYEHQHIIKSELYKLIVTGVSDNVDGKRHGTDDVSRCPTIHVKHGYGSGSSFYALYTWSSPITTSSICQSVYSFDFNSIPETTVLISSLECGELSESDSECPSSRNICPVPWLASHAITYSGVWLSYMLISCASVSLFGEITSMISCRQ